MYSEKMWKSFHAILSQEWNCEAKYDKIRIEEFGSIVGYLGGFAAGFDHMISEAHSLTGSLWFTGWNEINEGAATNYYIRFSKSAYGWVLHSVLLPGRAEEKEDHAEEGRGERHCV